LNGRRESLGDYIKEIEKIATSQKQRSKAIKVAKVIKPLYGIVQSLTSVLSAVSDALPIPSLSLVLGGIVYVLSFSSRFIDYHNKVVDSISSMLTDLTFVEKFESLYPQNKALQTAAVDVCADIVEFCAEVLKLLLDDKGRERGTSKLFLKSILKDFDSTFGDIRDNFTNHIAAFEKSELLADRERAAKQEATLGEEIKKQQSREDERNLTETKKKLGLWTLLYRFRDHCILIILIEERRQRILDRLPSVSFLTVQEDRLDECIKGTGEWLLQDQVFISWKTNSASELLWVHGKHGCGKSHLAACVIDHLSKICTESGSTAFAYIYCNPIDTSNVVQGLSAYPQDSNTVELNSLIGSFLEQLLRQLALSDTPPSLSRTVELDERPTRQQMKIGITEAIAKFTKTFLVIDGLDECHRLGDGRFRDFCEFIGSLAKSNRVNTLSKVIVFSRPSYTEIENAFAGCMKIQVDGGANSTDIKQFITLRASGLAGKTSPPILQEFKDKLFSRADGMFLWVNLVIRSLNNWKTTRERRVAIDELPMGLDTVYEWSMQRILEQRKPVKDRALRALLWTSNAMRPLSRNEILEALALGPQMTELDDEGRLSDDDGLAAECADLIILKDGHYQLLHSSLKDYLDGIASLSHVPITLGEFPEMHLKAHLILAELCLTYLNFNIFKIGPTQTLEELQGLQQANHLLKYAAVNWGRHLVKVRENILYELVMRFLLSEGNRELSMQNVLQSMDGPWSNHLFPYPGKTIPLHLLSIFNLVQVAERDSSSCSYITEKDGFGALPLDYAIAGRNLAICNWIIDKHFGPQASHRNQDSEPTELYSLLHNAAQCNWTDLTLRLIHLGYDVDRPNKSDRRAIHDAVSNGCESTLRILLDAGANPNSVNSSGDTPLLLAAEKSYTSLADILIRKGADVNIANNNGITALHRAAGSGNTAGLAEILLNEGANVEARSSEKFGEMTPLHWAADDGSHEVLQLLINKHADIESRNNDGATPLLRACSSGRDKCIDILLENGANIEARDTWDWTGLHLAVAHGHYSTLELLLSRNPNFDFLNATDEDGDTALLSAVIRGNQREAELLLDHGVRTDIMNENGRTALFEALEEGHTHIAHLLIRKHGIDLTCLGREDETTLHFVARSESSELVSTLIDTGVDPMARTKSGNTAAHIAAMQDNVAFIQELSKSVPELDFAAGDKAGESPLHSAARAGSLRTLQFLLDHYPDLATQKDNGLNTPAHLAAISGRTDCLKSLITPQNIDEHGYRSQTALWKACYHGHLATVEFLLQTGATVDSIDEEGYTALYATLQNKHIDVAKQLLDHNADPSIISKDGWTSLHQVIDIGNTTLVMRLLDAGCDALHTSQTNRMSPFLSAVVRQRMDIVDLFLDRGLDGSTIPDAWGSTCAHHAAGTGNVALLRKLLARNIDSVYAVNSLGQDLLHYAADYGHVRVLDCLMELGLTPDGIGKAAWTPAMEAASKGFPSFIERLIQLGSDMGKVSGPLLIQNAFHFDALHFATFSRRPRTVQKLLAASLDPTAKDVFGLSALDYARKDPKVWQAMGHFSDGYEPVSHEMRILALRRTIINCTEALIALSQIPRKPVNRRNEYRRVETIYILALALEWIKSSDSLETSRLCYLELLHAGSGQFHPFTNWLRCSLCRNKALPHTRYKCLECSNCFLCSDCYKDYLSLETASERAVSDSVLQIEKLEDDVRSVRIATEELREYGKLFSIAFTQLPAVNRWATEKLREFDAWNQKHNTRKQFKPENFPGWQLLKIVDKGTQILKEAEGTQQHSGVSLEGDPFSPVTDELLSLYANFNPDQEITDFICCGHEYLEILGESRMDDEEKVHFDQDTRLTRAFLERILAEYHAEIPGTMSDGSWDLKNSDSNDERGRGGLGHVETVTNTSGDSSGGASECAKTASTISGMFSEEGCTNVFESGEASVSSSSQPGLIWAKRIESAIPYDDLMRIRAPLESAS
jgi:ankyrin repeat protein